MRQMRRLLPPILKCLSDGFVQPAQVMVGERVDEGEYVVGTPLNHVCSALCALLLG